jgi:tetratricopeptide (TPR) repeat protein
MLRNIIRHTNKALSGQTTKQAITQIQFGLFRDCKSGKKSSKILSNTNSTLNVYDHNTGCQRRNLWWGAAKKVKEGKQIQEQLDYGFDLLEDDNKPQEALETFDKIVDQIDKNDTENLKILARALYGKAKAHAMLDQLDLAIESAQKAIDVDATDGYPYFLRGSLYLDSGDLTKAQEQFLKAVELTPDIYFAWIALAQMQFKEQNFAKAKEYALKAQEHGFDETLFFILGATAANERNLNLAEDYLRKSLKLHPNNTTTLTFLSTVCMEKQKYHDALELINRAIKLSSSNLPGLYLTKGEISFKLDEYGDAVMAYDKVLAVDKTNMQALDGVANSLLYLGQIQDALKTAKELVELYPESYKGWSTLATIHMALDDKEEALKCYNKSVDLTPNITAERREALRAKITEQVRLAK